MAIRPPRLGAGALRRVLVGLTVESPTKVALIILRREFGAASFGTVFGLALCGIRNRAAGADDHDADARSGATGSEALGVAFGAFTAVQQAVAPARVAASGALVSAEAVSALHAALAASALPLLTAGALAPSRLRQR